MKVCIFLPFFFNYCFLFPKFMYPFAVTAVDSGRRGLQFLGLDEEQSASGFDVNEFDNHRLLYAWNDRIRVA